MAGFEINKRAIEKMQRDIAKEFERAACKHPIRVPVQVDTPEIPSASPVSAGIEKRTLRASQRGRRVAMRDPGSPDRSRLHLRGTVTAGGVFSGEWEEWTLSGRHYRGVFQFLLARPGSELRGQRVGFNRYDTVQTSSWFLNRA